MKAGKDGAAERTVRARKARRPRLRVLLAAVLPALLPACAVMTAAVPRGWVYGGPGSAVSAGGSFGTLELRSVSVERHTEAASIEKELEGLAPRIFAERGFPAAVEGEQPRYAAELRAVEREYLEGWRMVRSISLEARILSLQGDAALRIVGRSTSKGTASLASSRDTERLLSAAVSAAAAELRRHDRLSEKR